MFSDKKTRVWPRVYGNSVPTPFRGTITLKDPQLEALIHKYAQVYGVDPSLVRAVMRHESGFKATAVSPKGAQGLMQLMPGTAALMASDPFDPEQNIAGGVGYLRSCLDRFDTTSPWPWPPITPVRRRRPDAAIPPYQETQVFVSNVLGTYAGLPDAKRELGVARRSSRPVARRQKGAVKTSKPKAAEAEKARPPRRTRPRSLRSYDLRPNPKTSQPGYK